MTYANMASKSILARKAGPPSYVSNTLIAPELFTSVMNCTLMACEIITPREVEFARFACFRIELFATMTDRATFCLAGSFFWKHMSAFVTSTTPGNAFFV